MRMRFIHRWLTGSAAIAAAVGALVACVSAKTEVTRPEAIVLRPINDPSEMDHLDATGFGICGSHTIVVSASPRDSRNQIDRAWTLVSTDDGESWSAVERERFGGWMEVAPGDLIGSTSEGFLRVCESSADGADAQLVAEPIASFISLVRQPEVDTDHYWMQVVGASGDDLLFISGPHLYTCSRYGAELRFVKRLGIEYGVPSVYPTAYARGNVYINAGYLELMESGRRRLRHSISRSEDLGQTWIRGPDLFPLTAFAVDEQYVWALDVRHGSASPKLIQRTPIGTDDWEEFVAIPKLWSTRGLAIDGKRIATAARWGWTEIGALLLDTASRTWTFRQLPRSDQEEEYPPVDCKIDSSHRVWILKAGGPLFRLDDPETNDWEQIWPPAAAAGAAPNGR